MAAPTSRGSASRAENTPRIRVPLTTGRCRNPRSSMISTASDTGSSGFTQTGLGVITSRTCVVAGSSARASTRVIRSRSVRMPSSASGGSITSTLPQLARVITQAAW